MAGSWTEEELAAWSARQNPQPSVAPATPSLECEIEAECTKILEQDGWRALRTDPVSDRQRGKGFGEVGMADHLYIRYRFYHEPLCFHPALGAVSEVLWVEFKRGKEQATKTQREWHVKERACGAVVWVANEDFSATVEGFRNRYEASGLMRRKKWW